MERQQECNDINEGKLLASSENEDRSLKRSITESKITVYMYSLRTIPYFSFIQQFRFNRGRMRKWEVMGGTVGDMMEEGMSVQR